MPKAPAKRMRRATGARSTRSAHGAPAKRPVNSARGAQIKRDMRLVITKVADLNKPRLVNAIEETVSAALSAVQRAAGTRWVRGPPTKPGGHGRLTRVVIRGLPDRKRTKYGAKGAAAAASAAAASAAQAAASESDVAVAAGVRALAAEADRVLPPDVAEKVAAIADASLVYKTKTEFGNRLEVRLSQIDEHGLGLYIMNDLNTEKTICGYAGLLVPGKVPQGASYTVVPIGGLDMHISPESEEENVGRYAYPCEHLPAKVCNARLVVDEDKLEARVVSTKYIVAGSEIFLQWPSGGAPRFSAAMEDKILELSMVEDNFLEEVAKWVPHNRGYLPVDYVENLAHHMLRYAKTPTNPHMHFNEHVLVLMREGGASAARAAAAAAPQAGDEPPRKRSRRSSGEAEGFIPVYDRLAGTADRPSQLPRPDGGTVILVGGPGHFAVWKFIYRGNGRWDSYVIDSMSRGYDSTSKIVRALNLFREEAAEHGMTIGEPRVINLGWQGRTVWSSNACGAFASLVSYLLMISDPEEVDPRQLGYSPTENMIKNLMGVVSRITAKKMADFWKPVKPQGR